MGPVVIYRQNVVEPGDSAPPEGPFILEDNYDQHLSPGMKAIVRGEAMTLINTTNNSDEEELNRVLEAIERMQLLKPKLEERRDQLKAAREAAEEAAEAAKEPEPVAA